MAAILVVEAEAVIAHDLARLIRQMGHTVDSAHSGEDALRTAEAGHPDLVIMDIGLQGQLNAIETATVLKEKFAVPVIYVIAHGMVVCGDPLSSGGHFGAVATGAPDDQAAQECRGLAKKVVMLATKLHSG